MRPAFLTVVLAGLAIVFPGASSGQTTTAGALHAACASPDPSRQSFCAGYIIGVVEGMQSAASVVLMQSGFDDPGEIASASRTLFGLCMSSGFHKNPYNDLLSNYINNNDIVDNIEAYGIVYRALIEKYPCRD